MLLNLVHGVIKVSTVFFIEETVKNSTNFENNWEKYINKTTDIYERFGKKNALKTAYNKTTEKFKNNCSDILE